MTDDLERIKGELEMYRSFYEAERRSVEICVKVLEQVRDSRELTPFYKTKVDDALRLVHRHHDSERIF